MNALVKAAEKGRFKVTTFFQDVVHKVHKKQSNKIPLL